MAVVGGASPVFGSDDVLGNNAAVAALAERVIREPPREDEEKATSLQDLQAGLAADATRAFAYQVVHGPIGDAELAWWLPLVRAWAGHVGTHITAPPTASASAASAGVRKRKREESDETDAPGGALATDPVPQLVRTLGAMAPYRATIRDVSLHIARVSAQAMELLCVALRGMRGGDLSAVDRLSGAAVVRPPLRAGHEFCGGGLRILRIEWNGHDADAATSAARRFGQSRVRTPAIQCVGGGAGGVSARSRACRRVVRAQRRHARDDAQPWRSGVHCIRTVPLPPPVGRAPTRERRQYW